MASDRSLFVEFLGDYPIIRVLDFLIENDVFDYSKKDVCRHAHVSWNTLQGFWKRLEKTGIVGFTRKVGKARLYKINPHNPAVQKLMELDKALIKKSLEALPGSDTRPAVKAVAGNAKRR
ncbi:MAG: hypothetical protein HY393_00645 [Candidatus Diapherotrites archaeon]|nr:hypothetical protein [Candidatus Diapherotrites archaeon]